MGKEKIHAPTSASIRSLQTQEGSEINFEDFMSSQVTGP